MEDIDTLAHTAQMMRAMGSLNKVMQSWVKKEEPTIQPVLSRRAGKYSVTLEEKWQSVDDAGNYYNSGALDEKVEWTNEYLATVKESIRTSWDTWQFKSKQDAEKFILFYTLRWIK